MEEGVGTCVLSDGVLELDSSDSHLGGQMRLRDYFIVSSEYRRSYYVVHQVSGCGWSAELHGRNSYEVDEIMSLVARHDEDCPCAEG